MWLGLTRWQSSARQFHPSSPSGRFAPATCAPHPPKRSGHPLEGWTYHRILHAVAQIFRHTTLNGQAARSSSITSDRCESLIPLVTLLASSNPVQIGRN